MTRQEAIEVLKHTIAYESDFAEAKQMAIKALESLVTCKECVFAEYMPKRGDYECHGNRSGLNHSGDWFCADGDGGG